MNYAITQISNKEAIEKLYLPFHYLTDQGQKHRPAQYVYGAFDGDKLIAACGFSGFPVAELFKGIWGIQDFRNFNQSGFHELSRLCVHPDYQQGQCFTSWFVSRCLKRIKLDYSLKGKRCKAVLSYADDDQHAGVIYAACNFKYYGLSAPKYNIWTPLEESNGGKFLPLQFRLGRSETHWKQQSRGWKEHLDNGGVKVMRGRKHRFLITWDKQLAKQILWKEEQWGNNKAGQLINTHPASTAHLR